MMRAALLAVALLLALSAGSACGGSRGAARPSVSKENAVLRFDTPIRDAEVWVDGRFYPGALRAGLEVPPGLYRVEIRHDDFHTVYLELRLARGERKTQIVRMAKKLN